MSKSTGSAAVSQTLDVQSEGLMVQSFLSSGNMC
ncbi:protein of unknown function [Methylorubrum extorquens]|uniref:Uncharacterized protein n=1 Tax=Methylorubrum extorquens TaxID=408 RepID=A0A2N9AYK5_METEX|nr:protein of unknown function [Methylorubrum extorquens]